MKCSHAKAHLYLNNIVPNIDPSQSFQVKCNRCGKWIGKKNKGYPLPRDMKVARFISLKITK
jgi:hypothetical protein